MDRDIQEFSQADSEEFISEVVEALREGEEQLRDGKCVYGIENYRRIMSERHEQACVA